MNRKIYWLNFKGQYGNDTNIVVNIPDGMTTEQARQLEDAFEGYITEWGNNNNDDYENFDYNDGISTAFTEIGVTYRHLPEPPIDYTIYV